VSELCRQYTRTVHHFVWTVVVLFTRGEQQKAQESEEQLLTLVQSAEDALLPMQAHHALGVPLVHLQGG
jgi:hypothetical protein